VHISVSAISHTSKLNECVLLAYFEHRVVLAHVSVCASCMMHECVLLEHLEHRVVLAHISVSGNHTRKLNECVLLAYFKHRVVLAHVSVCASCMLHECVLLEYLEHRVVLVHISVSGNHTSKLQECVKMSMLHSCTSVYLQTVRLGYLCECCKLHELVGCTARPCWIYCMSSLDLLHELVGYTA